MRDVYLWTAYGVGTVLLGCFLVALYRRYTDWSDRRSYVPPTIHTDVRWWASEDLDITEGRSDPSPALLTLDNTEGQPKPWALSALSDARKEAADTYATLAEFAGRSHATVAPIWAEIHGRRHVQGLAVA